ncbi:MAG: hypothetical protein NTX07_02680, partial [Solirubrobacterales bacterium]|nr:hypothetical protein [Solirubrobacterales bacterium]
LEGTVAAGKIVADIPLPDGSLIISVLRPEGGFVPRADTLINAGDEVLVVLAPGLETEVAAVFSGTQAQSGS